MFKYMYIYIYMRIYSYKYIYGIMRSLAYTVLSHRDPQTEKIRLE